MKVTIQRQVSQKRFADFVDEAFRKTQREIGQRLIDNYRNAAREFEVKDPWEPGPIERIECPSPDSYGKFIEPGTRIIRQDSSAKCPYCSNTQKSVSGLCIGCQAPW